MSLSSNPPPYGGVGPASGDYPAGPRPYNAEPEPSTADTAKDQAAQVAGTARDAGKHIAGVAGEQAGQVASEATHQVKQLVQQTRGELTEQAAQQQQRVASGLRSLSKELSAMAEGSEQPGMATDLVHQASNRTNAVASWLEQREPGHVVDEVTRFARQRPGAFLALAAGAGLLVGRLGRGLKAANDESNDTSGSQRVETQLADTRGQSYAPAALPPTPSYPPAPGNGSGGGYQPAPGYQQPPAAPGYQQAPGYPPQAPGYPPQAPGYPPQAPGYPQPQAPEYPQPPSYPPQRSSGYPQGASVREPNP